MANQLFRDKSIERISSPEQLNDYLKVTKPAVWAVLAAVILLLVGMLVWGSFTYIGSFVSGTALVEDGRMKVTFEDEAAAERVKEGMNVTIGETSDTIVSMGRDSDGKAFAQAQTELEDGVYDATVNYKTTQVLSLLFNDGQDRG